MAEMEAIPPQTMEEILNNAIDQTDGQVTYVTNMRVHATNNEITVDFYHVSSDPADTSTVVATRKHRLVLPVAFAKDAGEILLRVAQNWEATMGVRLPILPEGVDDDRD